jgi:ArsR family transcriptional regulator
MQEEAALFKVLADPTRLRLAALLSIRREACVCMLARALGEPDSKMSRHLKIMRSAGMVEARREGTWIYYRLAAPRNRLERCLQEFFRHYLSGHDTVLEDLGRLERAARPKSEHDYG